MRLEPGDREVPEPGRSTGDQHDHEVRVEQLEAHGAIWDLLAMRPPGDRSAASNLKRRTLDVLRAAGWEPRLAIDDDEAVVAAYARAGVPCFRAGFAAE